MKKIPTLIVDDEPLARSRIRQLLAEDEDIAIIGECSDGDQAVIALLQHKPDLLFLDVQMPERDGFSVISAVGAGNMPEVIFVTAFDEYALRAFDVCALDYLLKPFSEARFKQALWRAKERLQSVSSTEADRRLVKLLDALKSPQEYLKRVTANSQERLSFLETDKIAWIKAEGNYVRLHAGPHSFQLRETISHLETQLDPDQFIRVNRSTIVNINYIKELHQLFHGDYKVILQDGMELTLSRRFRDRLPRIVTKQ